MDATSESQNSVPRKKPRSALVAPLAASAFVAACFTALMVVHERVPSERRPRAARVLDGLADRALDFQFQLRGWRPPRTKIVLVLGDEAAFQRFGERPWDRGSVFAPMIEKLCGAGVRALAIDWLWPDQERLIAPRLQEALAPEVRGGPAALSAAVARASGDALVNQAIRACDGRVILPFSLEESENPATVEEFRRRFARLASPEGHNLVRSRVAPDVRLARQRFDAQATLPLGQVALTGLIDTPGLAPLDARQGFVNINQDGDGLYRRTQLFYRFQNQFLSSFALRTAQVAAGAHDSPPELSITGDGLVASLPSQSGPLLLPVDRYGDTLINYRGPDHFYPMVSLNALFEAGDAIEYDVRVPPFNVEHVRTTKAELFRDAVVLFSYSATGATDIRPRPFSQISGGYENQAVIVDNILSGELLARPLDNPRALALYAAAALAASLGFGWAVASLSLRWGSLLAAAGVGAVLVVNQLVLFDRCHLVFFGALLALQLTVQYLAIQILKHAATDAEKRQIRKAFDKYLSPEVIDLMLADPSRLKLGGEKRELTILFNDIRGFTSLSEKLDVSQLTPLLNEYLGAMTEILLRHRGTLDKYIGDAVMGFWGAPVPSADHALRAVTSAVEMVNRLARLNDGFKARYGVTLDIGIGINTGVVSVGNFGSESVFEYTVIGDDVNLASRLESVTKRYGARIVISQTTYAALPAGRFLSRALDTVAVAGRSQAVRLYEIIPSAALPVASRDATTEPTDDLSRSLAEYEAGLTLYQARRWAEARQRFENALAARPDDRAAALLADLCRQFETTPPPIDWNGSLTLDSK